MSQKRCFLWREAFGAMQTEKQQHLVAGVGERVDRLGQHATGTGVDKRDRFGNGDSEIGAERIEDRFDW